MDTSVSENLIRLRKQARLSQQRLAELAGITRQSISNYEKSRTFPDSKILARLAAVLNVEVSALLKDASFTIATNLRFRAHKGLGSQSDFQKLASLHNQKYCQLERHLDITPYAPLSLPCDSLDMKEIQERCAAFRKELGLGDEPILNLFEAVENLGLKVLRIPVDVHRFFGLSLFTKEGGAFILINSFNITVERQLFTLAHEIGHLICHRNEYADSFEGEGNILEEKIADCFASYLLVPEKEFERMLTQTNDIRQLKLYFNVSYQVILKRLADLDKIEYGKKQAQICSAYKRENGESLKRTMELPPALQGVRFPENRRIIRLIEKCRSREKISKRDAEILLQDYVLGLDPDLINAYSFSD